jgi:integrase
MVYRESSKSDKVTDAKNLLKQREGELATGKPPGIYFDRVLFDEFAEDFLTDYRVNGKDTLSKAERSVNYLKDTFGGMRAVDVTTDRVREYISRRQQGGLSNASINRELAALKRIFNLASQCTPPKVTLVPYIPMLKESNIRKGFFEPGEYVALRDALPNELKPVIVFAYHTGWRKEEILTLKWDQVDLKEGVVRLNPGETKNEEGRTVYLNEEVLHELKVVHSKRNLGCSYVFHRDGQPIKDFRGSWKSACKKVGIPSRIFHDFRRTAVRDLVRSGTPERVAMQISGHKTRSVFERYNIVSDTDLREAAIRKQSYHDNQVVTPIDPQRGEVVPFRLVQGQ